VDAVAQLEQEWPLLQQRALAQLLPRWGELQAPLRRFGSAPELLRFLHTQPPAQTDAPLLALLTLARADRLAGRFVLQAILPSLKAQAERIRHQRGRRDEVWELLFFYAWEAICSYPLDHRRARVAANLVLQMLHDTTRELYRPHSERDLPVANDRLERLARGAGLEPADARPLFSPEVPLLQAVAAGAIATRDAQLILETRVDGAGLHALAVMGGLGYDGLLKRRQRAEAALRGWLRAQAAVRKTAPLDLTPQARRFSRPGRSNRERSPHPPGRETHEPQRAA
jgi:hypothetical protein